MSSSRLSKTVLKGLERGTGKTKGQAVPACPYIRNAFDGHLTEIGLARIAALKVPR